MIDTLIVLGVSFLLLFFIAFFYLSRDVFLSGILKVRKAKVKHKEPFYILFIAWLVTAILLVGEFLKTKPGLSEWTYAGAAIFVIGGIIRILAKKQLHRFFSFPYLNLLEKLY